MKVTLQPKVKLTFLRVPQSGKSQMIYTEASSGQCEGLGNTPLHAQQAQPYSKAMLNKHSTFLSVK